MYIDIERILLELDNVPKHSQICLQGIKGNKDPFYVIGKVLDLNHKEEEFVFPNFNLPYTNSILKSLNMHRTRVMIMQPKTCYTYHLDLTKRIHIPLITNDKCFFVIEDKIVRYPADGNYYVVDTTKMHTAINASLEERIHIVGCIR